MNRKESVSILSIHHPTQGCAGKPLFFLVILLACFGGIFASITTAFAEERDLNEYCPIVYGKGWIGSRRTTDGAPLCTGPLPGGGQIHRIIPSTRLCGKGKLQFAGKGTLFKCVHVSRAAPGTGSQAQSLDAWCRKRFGERWFGARRRTDGSPLCSKRLADGNSLLHRVVAHGDLCPSGVPVVAGDGKTFTCGVAPAQNTVKGTFSETKPAARAPVKRQAPEKLPPSKGKPPAPAQRAAPTSRRSASAPDPQGSSSDSSNSIGSGSARGTNANCVDAFGKAWERFSQAEYDEYVASANLNLPGYETDPGAWCIYNPRLADGTGAGSAKETTGRDFCKIDARRVKLPPRDDYTVNLNRGTFQIGKMVPPFSVVARCGKSDGDWGMLAKWMCPGDSRVVVVSKSDRGGYGKDALKYRCVAKLELKLVKAQGASPDQLP